MLLEDLFVSVFRTDQTRDILLSEFLLCLVVALGSGLFLAVSYTYKNTHSKSFVTTLATLPAIVCVVIMVVNGDIGTGVAVTGVFSLVRFRSVPGTAREIGAIFIAMGSGLILGMGYLAYGFIFVVVLSICTLFYTNSGFGEKKVSTLRTMTVTIPEDLNYTNIFDDLMEQYTKTHRISFVKTTNMGSLFKITYDLDLKEANLEKEFIDQLRCRNGNLEITVSPMQMNMNEL
ncbi:MAG: DUF4956 domain-containing protein [Bacillota bacterium]